MYFNLTQLLGLTVYNSTILQLAFQRRSDYLMVPTSPKILEVGIQTSKRISSATFPGIMLCQ